MEHTTHTTDALEAELLELLAADAAQNARVEALLSTGTPEALVADIRLQLAQGAAELDTLERQQQVIERALG
jgi:hypothetical protein